MIKTQTVQSILFALFLTLGSLYCLYNDAFYLWMLAYEPQYKSTWDHGLHTSLIATLLFGVSWVSFVFWRRHAKRNARTGSPSR